MLHQKFGGEFKISSWLFSRVLMINMDDILEQNIRFVWAVHAMMFIISN